MAILGVLFDMDNTLLDFIGMKRASSEAAARAMFNAGADFPFGQQEAADLLFAEYMADIEGDLVFDGFVRKHQRQKLRVDQHSIDRITAAAVNAYVEAKAAWMRPFPGVRSTLIELARRGLKLGVITDAPRFKAYQRLDQTELTEHFDFVIATEDHGAAKPDQRAFKAALEQLSLPANQVLMVGDWPDRDVAGGKEAGMQTAWAGYGRPSETTPSIEPDFILHRFAELLKITAFQGAK